MTTVSNEPAIIIRTERGLVIAAIPLQESQN